MGVNPFVQPDFTGQTGATYKGSIDSAIAALARLSGWFHPQAQAVPDMTVRVLAGTLPAAVAGPPLEVAAQSTDALTAPAADPRRDIVCIDSTTGAVEVVAGAEDAAPADPAVPSGKIPVARINWTVGMAEIANADLDDLRSGFHANLLWRALAVAPLPAGSLADASVALAKIANLSNQRLIGRNTAGAGVPQEVTLTQLLDWIGAAARGDLLVRGASAWQRLAKGTAGQALMMGADEPGWDDPPAAELAAAQATTSGTAFDFTAPFADVNRATVIFGHNSLSGADHFLTQLGTASGFETSDYVSAATAISNAGSGLGADFTTGFGVYAGSGSNFFAGTMRLTRVSGNIWIQDHTGRISSSGSSSWGGGIKTLAGALTQIRVTRTGSSTFDAGSVAVIWER